MNPPARPVTQLAVAVRDGLADVRAGQLVLVACSGGADSLALAAVTARWGESRRVRVGAVVVDHGWSPAASRAGARTAVRLTGLGLDPVELVSVDATGPGGPEGAAREARYAALEEAAGRAGAGVVLLGHTLDDQAETVLLGLARGAGSRSLAGMAGARGPFRRPLLGLRRAVTEAACRELELRPWPDPANADPRYARVRVRNLAAELAAALGPGTPEALARTADLLREDADALDALATDLLLQATIMESRALRVAPLAAAPAALRRRALLAAARRAGCPAGALTRRHALALDGLLSAAPGAEVHLPGRVVARRAAETVGLTPG